MAPKTRNRNVATSDVDQQLPNLCFNVDGWATEHGIADRQPHQVINGLAISTTGYKKRLEQIKVDGKGTLRMSMSYTDKELATAAAPTQRYLVIGIAPLNLKPEHVKIAPGVKSHAVGIKETDNRIPFDQDYRPLIVVTPIIDRESDIKLYALVDEQKGLYAPYSISSSETFYFAEWRDATTSTAKRKAQWHRIIKEHLWPVTAGEGGHEKGEKVYWRRATENSKVTVEQSTSLSNQIIMLTSTFSLTKDRCILNMIKQLLARVDNDMEHRPPPSYDHLRDFIEGPDHLHDQDAQGVCDEIRKLWPEIQIDVKAVMMLHRGLRLSGISLQYHLLRGFLAFGCDMIMANSDNMEPVEVAKESYRVASLVIGSLSSHKPSTRLDHSMALIGALQKKLVEIRAANAAFSQELVKFNGDQVVHSLPEVWATFSDCVDQDTAKLALGQMNRYNAAALAEKTDTIGGSLTEVIDVLAQLELE